MRGWVSIVAGAIAVACSDPRPEATDAGLDPGDAAQPPSRSLYGLEELHELDLELPPRSMRSLRTQPRAWTCGELSTERGPVPVAVHLKGSASFRDIDGKAAFKLRFDACGGRAPVFGVRGMTLNNLVQDPSMVREHLGYQLFRAAGLPAPRTGVAVVRVNGQAYGVYANIENVDRMFLRRHFDSGGGPLFEGTLYTDIGRSPEGFEVDEGSEADRALFAKLGAALAEPGDDWLYGREPYFDAEHLVTYLAAEAVTGHWDGYAKPNNYRLYYEPGEARWYVIPWGLDQVWSRRAEAYASSGLLATRCFESARCLADYRAALARLLALAHDLDLEARADELTELLAEAVSQDSRRPHDDAAMDLSRQVLRVERETLLAMFDADLDCQVRADQLDADGDGHAACTDDCDDGDPWRHPGAPELCNGVDDDCNLVVDDAIECACDSIDLGDARFELCGAELPWRQARDVCRRRGGELASIDDAEQNFALWRAGRWTFGRRWLIGLNDIEEEGEYRWVGGDEATLDLWNPGEPNNVGNEDCVELSPPNAARWNDIGCHVPRSFACRFEDDE